jgi:DNA repair protein RadD
VAERDYQIQAINTTFDYLNATTGNGVIVQPTGVGKSHTISGIVRRALQYRPNARIQMLTDKKELIKQNVEKLVDHWPTAPVGIYSAGLKTKQKYMPITYGGIASMVKVVEDFDAVDLVLVDEAHRMNPNVETLYGRYMKALREKNPYVRLIGLTATDWRMGFGKLTDEGGIFDDVIINQGSLEWYNWFVDQGYLVPLIPRPTQTVLDTTGVGMSGGDLNMSEVQRKVDRQDITWAALQELCYWGQNRHHWLIFAAGVDHADHITEMLNYMGIPTTCVHRGISDRDQRIADYKAGRYRCMVNNNILTTGFDYPGIDLIGMFRPTLSSSLWVQMLGRGTRPVYAPGWDIETREGRLAAIANSYKQNCMVLDFADNISQMGPINDPVLPRRAGLGGGEPPIKTCTPDRLVKGQQHCGSWNHASVRYCAACGAEFDFAIKYGVNASIKALVATGVEDIEWFDVQNIYYSEHIGASGIPCLRVDYWVGPKKKFMDYIHLQQNGWVLHRAKEWWKARFAHPDWGVPPTVKEALPYCTRQYLKEPKRIRVHKNHQPYPEILNYEYE